MSQEINPQVSDTSKMLATNIYPWLTFYRRQGRDFEANLESSIKEIKQSGTDSLEPILSTPEKTVQLADVLIDQGVAMVSAYVNSKLHEKADIQDSIETVLKLARIAQDRMGTKIIVTNPIPSAGLDRKTKTMIKSSCKASHSPPSGKPCREKG